MISYKFASANAELESILELQRANLSRALSTDEIKAEGFVTLEHDLPLLKKMNEPYGHCLAKDGEKIVGYALVMLKALENEMPLLLPMFEKINRLAHEGMPLKESKYFVMGQVCIDKDYRGKGIFSGLYTALKNRLHNDFDYIITEISGRNQRSIRAHEKVGFTLLHRYYLEGEEWNIVIWNISNES